MRKTVKRGTIKATWTVSVAPPMGSMPRIYVAGPYSPTNNSPTEMLGNMRRGIRAASKLLQLGYAPFCPFVDFMYWMVLREGEEITKEQIWKYSLVWLPACQGVLLLPGWHKSPGALNEAGEATHHGIPLFTSIKKLREHFEQTRIYSKRAKPKRS